MKRAGYQPVEKVAIADMVTVVQIKAFGSIQMSRVVSKDGDGTHCVTDKLMMNELVRLELAK